MRESLVRARVHALDSCLALLENALADGQVRVDAVLGCRLRDLLGAAGLVPNHRLEGRKVERVLDDVFELQAGLLGQNEEQAAS